MYFKHLVTFRTFYFTGQIIWLKYFTDVNTLGSQRGLIGTAVPIQATLEGSSCTSIMTCTGGCDYSF